MANKNNNLPGWNKRGSGDEPYEYDPNRGFMWEDAIRALQEENREAYGGAVKRGTKARADHAISYLQHAGLWNPEGTHGVKINGKLDELKAFRKGMSASDWSLDQSDVYHELLAHISNGIRNSKSFDLPKKIQDHYTVEIEGVRGDIDSGITVTVRFRGIITRGADEAITVSIKSHHRNWSTQVLAEEIVDGALHHIKQVSPRNDLSYLRGKLIGLAGDAIADNHLIRKLWIGPDEKKKLDFLKLFLELMETSKGPGEHGDYTEMLEKLRGAIDFTLYHDGHGRELNSRVSSLLDKFIPVSGKYDRLVKEQLDIQAAGGRGVNPYLPEFYELQTELREAVPDLAIYTGSMPKSL